MTTTYNRFGTLLGAVVAITPTKTEPVRYPWSCSGCPAEGNSSETSPTRAREAASAHAVACRTRPANPPQRRDSKGTAA
jgi:hypothetical protein